MSIPIKTEQFRKLVSQDWERFARLIAASPTMYSYLQELAGKGDERAAEIIASIAIQKAEGDA